MKEMKKEDTMYNLAFAHTKLRNFNELEKMIKSGFEINTINTVGQNLLTNMFYASFKTKEEGIHKLIELGINVDFVDDSNQTALYYACNANMSGVVEDLIKHHANPTLGKDIISNCLGKDKSEIRSILLKSPLLSAEQKDTLLNNQHLEPKLIPTNIKFSDTSDKVSLVFSKEFGFLKNVWCTNIFFNLNDCYFALGLVRINNQWHPTSLAHKYNYENNAIYCPFCKNQNPSSVNCEEALPLLKSIYSNIIELTNK